MRLKLTKSVFCFDFFHSRAGCLATAGILGAGLYSMVKGNAALSQRIMRARVVSQGLTVAFVGLGSLGYTFFMPAKKIDEPPQGQQ